MFFQFMLICSVSMTSVGLVTGPRCNWNQYRLGLKCCPACSPGKKISKDCTDRRITICTICTNGTFQEGINGQKQCSNCTKCDTGLGLKVKKSCTSTSDALCEPLDGYFCSDSNRGGCMAAQRHTVCSPGEYIGQRGTADKDTECLECTDGTFSNGTSLSCQDHTKCESVGQNLMKPGNDSTDSECGEHGVGRRHVAGIIPGIILALIIAIIARRIKGRPFVYETSLLEEQEWELKELSPMEGESIPCSKQSSGSSPPTSDLREEAGDRVDSGLEKKHSSHYAPEC